jgi:cytochrome b561/polyisoprenoid-binding protein YceI
MLPQRYSLGAIALHWLIAAALVFQIVFAESLEGPGGPDLFARYQLHKSVGITILLLSVLRLGWRFVAPRPAPAPGPKWAMTLSGLVHFGFYFFMIAAPVTGWIIVSTSKIKVDTLLFGTIPWPHLPVPASWGEPAEFLHHFMPNIAIALLVLHVAGALRHQYLLGTPILARMLPGGQGKAIGALVTAAAIMLGAVVLGNVIDPRGAAQAAKPAAVATTPVAEPALDATPAAAPEGQEAEAEDEATDDEANAEPRNWVVAKGGTLGFSARWNGEPVDGRFARWTANILFSPEALDASKIDVSIDLGSVDTGDGQRDGTLTGSDFFDTGKFAKATYRASKFKALGGNRYRADGTLTLRGVSKSVPLNFTLDINGDKARAKGSATIDRTSFGVGQGDYASTAEIAGPVAVSFDLQATARD